MTHHPMIYPMTDKSRDLEKRLLEGICDTDTSWDVVTISSAHHLQIEAVRKI